MQGQLRHETQSVTITTECAINHQTIHIEIDSDLIFRIHEEDADPWLYLPLIDFGKLKDPSITDVF